ncbi:C-factor [Amphibalanus amphitrite]|uniref:C-factor n=1 Tax=Amphibalanus amphitrite TaxID=1232801 RepID=A0A6A4VFM8_AMPAM|nr:C-factor-like [Amphibalanus amphitrite]XP_043209219.1 C-factor-like [Amphibalanus amphitrite]KAF0291959.1 C-factor [Amphibalanus amphitrite]
MAFSVLVTGANRGIGLELTRRLVSQSGTDQAKHVFATCRNTGDCKDLDDIKEKHDNLHILELDVTDEASYPRLVKQVEQVVKGDGLNLLINNAGFANNQPLHELTSEQMRHMYDVNCIAPIMLTKAFLPLLRAGSHANPDLSGEIMCWKRAAVVNINSRMGSIADNGMGKFYAYRASKAAQNAVTRSLGIDLRPERILVVSVDPGWVQTRMGGPNGKISPEESARRIVSTLSKLGPEHTSTYMDNLGEPLPW